MLQESSPWKKEGWDNRLGEPFSLPPWPNSGDGDMSERPGQRLESWLGFACRHTQPRVLGPMNNVCFQSDGLLLPPQFHKHAATDDDLYCSYNKASWLAHQMSFVITFGNDGFTRGPKQKTRQMERLQDLNKRMLDWPLKLYQVPGNIPE